MSIETGTGQDTLERHKQLIYDMWRDVTAQDLDAVRTYYHADAVYHAGSGDLTGREAIMSYYQGYYAGFPDFKGEVSMIVAEGDLVAHMAKVSGTNSGDFLGIPATGKFVSSSGMLMTRMRDGKIIEEWECFDYSDVMRQLGLA